MPGLLVCLVLQNAGTMPVTCRVRRMLCQQIPGYKKSSKHLYVEIDNEKWNINILEDKIVVFLRFRVIKIVKMPDVSPETGTATSRVRKCRFSQCWLIEKYQNTEILKTTVKIEISIFCICWMSVRRLAQPHTGSGNFGCANASFKKNH